MTVAAKGKTAKEQEGSGRDSVFDRELEDLPQDLRWREWMGRIEAVLFAGASPVGRDDLARVVGEGASVEMLIEDIQAELAGRPYELAQVARGWSSELERSLPRRSKLPQILTTRPSPSRRWKWACFVPSPITSPSTGRD